MQKYSILFMLDLLVQMAFSQPKVDSVLYYKLRGMFQEDQKWRKEYIKLQRHQQCDYNEETVTANMGKSDSLNELEAKNILKKYGYPGYAIAGEAGSSWFWAIVQHCDDDVQFQQKVVKLMYRQVMTHNAAGEDYAYLQDRVLNNMGKKQLYGTQTHFDGKAGKNVILPVHDSLNVDKRRKALGLAPLKQYLKELNGN